jgi:hypothetical protein
MGGSIVFNVEDLEGSRYMIRDMAKSASRSDISRVEDWYYIEIK